MIAEWLFWCFTCNDDWANGGVARVRVIFNITNSGMVFCSFLIYFLPCGFSPATIFVFEIYKERSVQYTVRG